MSQLRRYLLFAGNERPVGGWSDFVNSFDVKIEAMGAGNRLLRGDKHTWWHVIDTEQNRETADSRVNPRGL